MIGKIICINKSIYSILFKDNTVKECFIRGKLRKENITPVVGDDVFVTMKTNMIESVSERKNYLERPLIANIDKLFIVMSTSIPSFSSYLIDKFLVIAYQNNIEPVIIITKKDMIGLKDKFDIRKYTKYYKKIGIKVYNNTQISKIKNEFKGHTVALTGQTGAGKSSLLNRIDKTLKLETNEVSKALGRGKHTTRLVKLIPINGSLVADTPGFSSLELVINKNDLRKYYKDFDGVCKYNKSCLHDKEDGCAIKEKVNKNVIPVWRYENYIKLLGEIK